MPRYKERNKRKYLIHYHIKGVECSSKEIESYNVFTALNMIELYFETQYPYQSYDILAVELKEVNIDV